MLGYLPLRLLMSTDDAMIPAIKVKQQWAVNVGDNENDPIRVNNEGNEVTSYHGKAYHYHLGPTESEYVHRTNLLQFLRVFPL
jgi:hypothetical protein